MRRMEGKEQALERAKEFLKSAEACWQADGLVGCALWCYVGMFWAAIAVLTRVRVRKENGCTAICSNNKAFLSRCKFSLTKN